MSVMFEIGKNYLTRGRQKAVFACDAREFGADDGDDLIFIIAGGIHQHNPDGRYYSNGEDNHLDIVGAWEETINVEVNATEYADGSITAVLRNGGPHWASPAKRTFKATLIEKREP